MAMFRTGHAALTTSIVAPDKWIDKKVAPNRVKIARDVIAKYDPSKYLLSHCSIIASVDVDLADENNPKSNWLIKPEWSMFVNNNGDSWERNLLKNCYQTFVGADNYCFPAGTRVLMSDGTYKSIELIVEGDKVINRKGEIGKVTKLFKHTANNLVELKGQNILLRSLFVTNNHPFWLYHARETCPKTGRPNFFNPTKDFYQLDSWVGFSQGVHRYKGEFFPVGLSPNWIEAGSIDPNRDFFTHPVSSIEIENEEINENRAELIGWFLAEGWYSQVNIFSDSESGIVFALGNDEIDIANRLSDLLTKEFGQLFRVDCKPRVYESESGSYTLALCNAEVAKFFKKWCGKYAWSKKLSEEAMWLPKKLQAIILKNCINGDGCGVIMSKGYTLEMKSQALIQQLNWISWRLGLLPTYKETGVLKRYTDLEMVDGYEVYTDPLTGKKSRPGYMIRFSTRDSKKLNNFLNFEDIRMSSRQSNRSTQVFNNDEGSWLLSKIDLVNKSNVVCDVYNIEVEGDNSYIAEGVVVHNCEHVQIPELSKGKIIDIALREVPFMKKDGVDLTTLYADILVATDRKHVDLVDKIKTGEYNSLSMGCLIEYSQCSKCGKIAKDETEACIDIRFFKKNFFYDRNGVKRIIAELCGRAEDKDSCKFIEASWVKKPAFEGAVLRNLVEPNDSIADKLQFAIAVPSTIPKPGDMRRAASMEASKLMRQLNGQDAPAPEAPAKEPPPPPADDAGFPSAAPENEKTLTPDQPPAPEAPAPEDAPPAGDAGLGGAPGAETPLPGMGGAPGDPGAAPAAPQGDPSVQEVKDMFKRNILREIRDELVQKDQKPIERPIGLENESNSSLVKDASMTKVLKMARETGNDRLLNGLIILSNIKDWKRFKKYGYSREDVLGLLHYVDKNISDKPVGADMIKALTVVKEASNATQFFTEMIVEAGRTPSINEAKKLSKWSKILSQL